MSQTARPGREWRLPVCQARLQPVADAGLELMSREGKERQWEAIGAERRVGMGG
jgi:hypothetical protein